MSCLVRFMFLALAVVVPVSGFVTLSNMSLGYHLRCLYNGFGEVVPFLTDADCGMLYFVDRSARSHVVLRKRRFPPWCCAWDPAWVVDARDLRHWFVRVLSEGHTGLSSCLIERFGGSLRTDDEGQWVQAAIVARRFELAKHLHSLSFRLDTRSLSFAVHYGVRDVVQWLLSVGCPRDNSAVLIAAETGSVDMLRILRDAEPGLGTGFAAIRAVLCGHVDVLRYMVSTEFPIPTDIIRYARSDEMRTYLASAGFH